MHRRDHARLFGPSDLLGIVEGRCERAETGFGEPNTVISQFGEVAFVEAWLENDRAGMDPHAPRAIGLETARRSNRERLDANRVFWTARTWTSDAEIAVVTPPCR